MYEREISDLKSRVEKLEKHLEKISPLPEKPFTREERVCKIIHNHKNNEKHKLCKDISVYDMIYWLSSLEDILVTFPWKRSDEIWYYKSRTYSSLKQALLEEVIDMAARIYLYS